MGGKDGGTGVAPATSSAVAAGGTMSLGCESLHSALSSRECGGPAAAYGFGSRDSNLQDSSSSQWEVFPSCSLASDLPTPKRTLNPSKRCSKVEQTSSWS